MRPIGANLINTTIIPNEHYKRIKVLIYRIFGVTDFHTHLRLRELVKRLDLHRNEESFLEIGCGCGVVAYEVLKRNNNTIKNYVGVDFNGASIRIAEKYNESFKRHCKFIIGDAFEYLCNYPKGKDVDCIILMDVLEHIENDKKFVSDLLYLTKPNKIIVSVPTPKYPIAFGEEYHKNIGHVRAGYELEQLDRLFACEDANGGRGYKRTYNKYNTGIVGRIGVTLFYKKLIKVNEYIRYILVLPFLMFDINSAKFSCEIYAEYERN